MNNLVIKDAYPGALTGLQMLLADVICLATIYNRLGYYTVQAGEAIELGVGMNGSQSDANGRIFVNLNATGPVAIPGSIRFSIEDAQGRNLRYIWEGRTEGLSANSTDRSKQVPFPRTYYAATEDKRIVMEFKPDANATVESTTISPMVIDITRYILA